MGLAFCFVAAENKWQEAYEKRPKGDFTFPLVDMPHHVADAMTNAMPAKFAIVAAYWWLLFSILAGAWPAHTRIAAIQWTTGAGSNHGPPIAFGMMIGAAIPTIALAPAVHRPSGPCPATAMN